MKELVLEVESARATIIPERGALISSLRLQSQSHPQQNILWMPKNFERSSSAWPGGGLPFLFPFAGRVWHQGQLYHYGLGDSVYPMPLHGFSWAAAWTVAPLNNKSKKNEAILELHSSETSLSLYPFHFHIQMTITLESDSLKVEVAIKHISPVLEKSKKMPVAIGWHPYLALSQSGNSITIPAETVLSVTAQGGAGKPQRTADLLGASPWALPKQEIQSLILSDLSQGPSILNKTGQQSLHIFSGPSDVLKHIVTWTNEPAEFHCIEPWMSLPDAVAAPTGCRWLSAGESLNAWIKLSLAAA